jgi:hypothetical protein
VKSLSASGVLSQKKYKRPNTGDKTVNIHKYIHLTNKAIKSATNNIIYQMKNNKSNHHLVIKSQIVFAAVLIVNSQLLSSFITQ